jgi:formate hydrogenlyase transcriptional activator
MPEIAAVRTTRPFPFAWPDAFSEPEKLFASFFNSSTAGLCILDSELRYLAINDMLAAMNGRLPADHLGKTVREIVGSVAEKLEPEFRRVLATGRPVLDFEVSAVLPTRAEASHWIAHYFPIKDAEGRVSRIGAVVIDITEQKHLEQRLEALAQRLLLEKGRLQTLREIDQALSSHKSMRTLFQVVAACIGKIVPCDFAGTWLYDQGNQVMRAAALDSRVGEVFREGEATPVSECILGQSMLAGNPGSVDYAEFVKVDDPGAKKLLEHGIQSVCSLPLISPKGPRGALGLGSCQDHAFSPEDVAVLNHAATSIALALESTLTHAALEQQKERLQALLEVSNTLTESKVDFPQSFPTISAVLQKAVPHDSAFLTVVDQSAGTVLVRVLSGLPVGAIYENGMKIPIGESLSGQLVEEVEARNLDRRELEKYAQRSPRLKQVLEQGYLRACFVPLITARGTVGFLFLGRKEDAAFTAEELDFLRRVASEMALAVEASGIQNALIQEKERLKVLHEIDATLLSSLDIQQLLPAVYASLQRALAHDDISIFLYDESASALRDYGIASELKRKILPENGLLRLDDSITGRTYVEGKTRIVDYAELANAPFAIARRGIEEGVRSLCQIPLRIAKGKLGVLSLISRAEHAFGANDIGFLEQVAAALAHALGNAQAHKALRLEEERLRVLLKTGASVASNLDIRQVFPSISAHVRHVKQHEFASLLLLDPELGVLRRHAVDFPLAKTTLPPDFSVPLDTSPAGRALKLGRPLIYSRDEISAFGTELTTLILNEGLQSLCCVPLTTSKDSLGTLNFGSTKPNAFEPEDFELFSQIAAQVAVAIENERAYREIEQLKNRLAAEKQYLEGEIRTNWNFEEIVGESLALKHVLDLAATVAASSATVLVLGETGTGKELIARAIHRMSRRKDRNFIKLNCAAIPTGLLESELFGHEKGAFTGAITQKVGRMELADGGTLFLDEVGEIPLELQPKLLRVLQDQEFERLGSIRTIKVDVRLVTATNRDLARSVAEREFRSDLFYRINVFPLVLPSLRERREDIPLLVRYFVRKFAERLERHIETIPKEAMKVLMEWDWPGNVRELENLMERSVILSDGPVLRIPLSELRVTSAEAAPEPDRTLDATEREHILRVLRETGGVLSGPNGAAGRLGLKRTTLQSKMSRLHITRQDYSLRKRG